MGDIYILSFQVGYIYSFFTKVNEPALCGITFIYFRNLYVAGVFNSVAFIVTQKLNQLTVQIFGTGTYYNLRRSHIHSPKVMKMLRNTLP